MPPEDTGAKIGRKAGRFVRATGLAVRAATRELERGAPASSNPEQAAQTPPATPPPAEAAPRKATTRRRRARKNRPEPTRNRILDPAIFFLWILTFNAAGFVVVQLDLFIPKGTVRMAVDFTVAAIFLAMAWLLVADPWQSRQRLLIRIVRGKNREHEPTRGSWRSLLWGMGRDGLTFFGIVCLGLGLWTAARGVM